MRGQDPGGVLWGEGSPGPAGAQRQLFQPPPQSQPQWDLEGLRCPAAPGGPGWAELYASVFLGSLCCPSCNSEPPHRHSTHLLLLKSAGVGFYCLQVRAPADSPGPLGL